MSTAAIYRGLAALTAVAAVIWLMMFALAPGDRLSHWWLAIGIMSAVTACGQAWTAHRHARNLRGSAPEPPASLRDGGERH